jgi:uncharacterized protein YbjT (DUF2867 family)
MFEMTKQDESVVLVVGATGTVGGATARELLARGGRVRALVRDKTRAVDLDGAELVEGDLRDTTALRDLLANVHTAFYVSPHEPDEEQLARDFTRACEEQGVRLVFVGVHVDAKSRFVRALLRLYLGRLMPAYAPKLRLSERARNSKTNAVVLMPTNYFENDEFFKDDLSRGAFLQPFDRPFNRVAVRDIAEVAAKVCLDRGFPAGAYPVIGPESLDGAACAATWTRALGREVVYRTSDSAFEAAVQRAARGKKADDLLASYAAIRKIDLPTSKRDLARTTALLGRPPTPYATYVQGRARAWATSA